MTIKFRRRTAAADIRGQPEIKCKQVETIRVGREKSGAPRKDWELPTDTCSGASNLDRKEHRRYGSMMPQSKAARCPSSYRSNSLAAKLPKKCDSADASASIRDQAPFRELSCLSCQCRGMLIDVAKCGTEEPASDSKGPRSTLPSSRIKPPKTPGNRTCSNKDRQHPSR